MHKVLVEIKSTLNSRLLTNEYDEAGGEMVMPAHLIFGRKIQSARSECVRRK